MTPIDPAQTLGEILRAEPGYERVFRQAGFSVARDASRTLDEICREAGLDTETTVRLLIAFSSAAPSAPPSVEIMSLSQICDHLENVHHPALLEKLAQAEALLPVLPNRKTDLLPPRIASIRKHFAKFRGKLTLHLLEEAEALFPLIRQLENRGVAATGVLDLLKDPLARMKKEHSEADEDLAILQNLTAEDANDSCDPEILAKLRQLFGNLEEMLQGQIYQENQVLFRRTLAMLSA